MSLFPRPLLVNGATHPAQQFRMMIRDLARGSEGITEGDDLKVTALGTPGASVQVAPGSATVRGRANVYQGSYSACNLATENVSIAATGGTGRSDMVVLRVEDPEYEGSINPATGNVAYFQVISNVSSSATAIPDGRTAIPLARIDIPASTSTITNAYITDLRKCANPRRDRTLWTQSPASLSTQISGTAGTYSYFSTAVGWNIPVPDWATTAKIALRVGGLRYASNAFFGGFRATFGASLTMQPTVLDDNQTGVRRQTAEAADTLTIPSAYRGTTQLLRAQACGSTGNAGTVGVDSSSTFVADVEFFEAPR